MSLSIKMNPEEDGGMIITVNIPYHIKIQDENLYKIFIEPLNSINLFMLRSNKYRQIHSAAVEVLNIVSNFCWIHGSYIDTTSIDDKCETYVSIYNEMLNNISIELISGYLFHVYMEIVNMLYDNCNSFENTSNGVEFEFSDGKYITYNDTNIIAFISNDTTSNTKEDEEDEIH